MLTVFFRSPGNDIRKFNLKKNCGVSMKQLLENRKKNRHNNVGRKDQFANFSAEFDGSNCSNHCTT
jgi:hypothetical protein